MSQAMGRSTVTLDVKVYAPCKKHIGKSTQFCGCKPNITAHGIKEHDLKTSNYALLEMVDIFAATQTLTDTSNATHSVTVANTPGTIQVVAGTGSTTPAVSDYKLQTQTAGSSGYVTATIGTYVPGTTTGQFPITGTITNGSGSDITYKEIGVYLTIATFIYCVLHDLVNGVTGYLVSNGGTMACTYTITNS